MQDFSVGGPLSAEWGEYAQYKTDIGRQMALSRWLPGHISSAKILESEPRYLKRRVLEAIWISRNSNLDCGLVINQTWLPYFDWTPHFSISHSLLSITFTQQSSIPVCISLLISFVLCTISSFSWWRSTDQNVLHCCSHFYAMLSKKDHWNNEYLACD